METILGFPVLATVLCFVTRILGAASSSRTFSSAFIRAAIERELAGRESGVDAAEERIAASLDRVIREIRDVKLGSRPYSHLWTAW
jgi:hypothetical protein